MIPVKSYAAFDTSSPLRPYEFCRRDPGTTDVLVDILFCGICHTDIHQARDEWGGSIYPMVPGHEIVGRVAATGTGAIKFRPGDAVAIGPLIDSCRVCPTCTEHLEQYCIEGYTGAQNGYLRDGKTIAQGGYATKIVIDERFVHRVPPGMDLKAVAPLLCAGITTYSPLRHAGVTKGTRVGVLGLGGLGHLGVKFAASFGAEVTAFSTSASKEEKARRWGACQFVLTTDQEQMAQNDSQFDVLLDTISGDHDYEKYLDLLALDGVMIIVGIPPRNPQVKLFSLMKNRRRILGGTIGGTKETQAMLDYCAENNILADVELISIDEVNAAYERLLKGDVDHRFVIDLDSLRQPAE